MLPSKSMLFFILFILILIELYHTVQCTDLNLCVTYVTTSNEVIEYIEYVQHFRMLSLISSFPVIQRNNYSKHFHHLLVFHVLELHIHKPIRYVLFSVCTLAQENIF